MISFSTKKVQAIYGHPYVITVTSAKVKEWINVLYLMEWMDDNYPKFTFTCKWIDETITVHFKELEDRNGFIRQWLKDSYLSTPARNKS